MPAGYLRTFTLRLPCCGALERCLSELALSATLEPGKGWWEGGTAACPGCGRLYTFHIAVQIDLEDTAELAAVREEQ